MVGQSIKQAAVAEEFGEISILRINSSFTSYPHTWTNPFLLGTISENYQKTSSCSENSILRTHQQHSKCVPYTLFTIPFASTMSGLPRSLVRQPDPNGEAIITE